MKLLDIQGVLNRLNLLVIGLAVSGLVLAPLAIANQALAMAGPLPPMVQMAGVNDCSDAPHDTFQVGDSTWFFGQHFPSVLTDGYWYWQIDGPDGYTASGALWDLGEFDQEFCLLTPDTTTDAAGHYDVTVEFLTSGGPDGQQGDPAYVTTTSYEVEGGTQAPPPAYSISGQKWKDTDGDGVWGENEPALNGVEIDLYSGDTISDTDITHHVDYPDQSSLDGVYSFEDLLAGEYIVCEVVPTGYEQTYPNPEQYDGPLAHDGTCYDITLTESSVSNMNFGNHPLPQLTPPPSGGEGSGSSGQGSPVYYGQIKGRVFGDTNQNGAQDADEPGLGGWTIYLDINNDNTLDGPDTHVLSGTNGDFLFSGLADGTYTVRANPLADWGVEYPAASDDNEYSVTISKGVVIASVNPKGLKTQAVKGNGSGVMFGGVLASKPTPVETVPAAPIASVPVAVVQPSDGGQVAGEAIGGDDSLPVTGVPVDFLAILASLGLLAGIYWAGKPALDK